MCDFNIYSEDPHCVVQCDCGEELSISNYKIFICPKCGYGYRTNFEVISFDPYELKSIKEDLDKI